MLFNSLEFLIFFPIVILVYYIIPKKIQHIWLLIASYYFYMCWNAKYALLMFASTFITYVSGLALEKIKGMPFHEKKRLCIKKWIVASSFLLNLGILFFFKYTHFALSILTQLLARINIEFNSPSFDIILPVGISFYTFQALSYTMDVYRDEICAEKNFLRYALFVSFFPQLVAGPIEKSKNLLKQLETLSSRFDFKKARSGVLLMLWGYFLKIVIADRIAIFVDTVYGDISVYGGYYIAVATVLFAFQIYCDFYGYSVIAMGTAEILGITLTENFNAPYLSTSVADFWHRWHVSLTSWFKDYLYFPLGGSRKGKLRKYVNKLIVFLVSGLWHGASLSFVVWGGLNGLYQIIGEVLAPLRTKANSLLHLNRENISHKIVAGISTFILIDISWIFFRADTLRGSIDTIRSMCTVHNPWILFDGSLYNCGLDSKNFGLMIIGILVLIFADICKLKGIHIRKIIFQQDYWCRWFIIVFTVLFILVFGIWGTAYDSNGFIYFQF